MQFTVKQTVDLAEQASKPNVHPHTAVVKAMMKAEQNPAQGIFQGLRQVVGGTLAKTGNAIQPAKAKEDVA